VLALVLAATLAPDPAATMTPAQLLARVRQQFRSHRPPPPYETYTLERRQARSDGTPDVERSYVDHVWVRNGDRAALERRVAADGTEGPPRFDRPAFNEARDPGPPTADLFEPKPRVPHPVAQAYTPEPALAAPAVIGRVTALGADDYRVTGVSYEGDLLHLTLAPVGDPDRHRLREIFADRTTYELRRVVAADTLFVRGSYDDAFAEAFTIALGAVDGIPVVTRIRAQAGSDRNGQPYRDDGRDVELTFSAITFPPALPDWYFDPTRYGAHQHDLPS
jgi:hypothetical protein